MILELDLGNTRVKWRILTAGAEVVARGVDSVEEWLSSTFPREWYAGVQHVRIASVLSAQTESQLAAKIQAELSVSPAFARPSSHCSGLSSAYADPERLGVDRWLALIAAYRYSNKAALVIDAGTALKVDAVDGVGRHIGGYIIPGASLMERALFEGTDRVRYQGISCLESLVLGVDTRSCVQNGIAAALSGAVLVAIEQCRSKLDAPTLFVTGGLGGQLRGCLEALGVRDIRFETDLVLDGLQWALPFTAAAD